MLVGEAGSGKSLWMYVLLDYYLKKSTKCAFIAVDDSPSKVRPAARLCVSGIREHESSGRLAIVDAYSPLAGEESDEKYAVAVEPKLVDFEETIASLVSKGARVFFLDSAIPLFARYDDRAVLALLTKACGRVKSKGGTFFFSTAPELLREPDRAILPHFVDALIEFRHAEVKPTATVGDLGLVSWLKGKPRKPSSPLTSYIRELRLSKMRGNRLYDGWIPFMIGKTGILLALPADPEENKRLWEEVHRIPK